MRGEKTRSGRFSSVEVVVRRSYSLFFIVLCMAGFAHAQIPGIIGTVPQDLLERGPIGVPLGPQILPISNYSYSSSTFDHDGNLLIMDVLYSSPLAPPGQPVILRLPGTTKTRVTVITSAGTPLAPREYEGSLQVTAVGRNGVYAFLTTYSNTTTSTTNRSSGGAVAAVIVGFNTTRKLVSLRVGASGLPAALPAVEVPLRADVKISAADTAGGLDSIAFVDTVLGMRPLAPPGSTTPAPVEPRTVQLHKSDGNSFIAVTANPIPLP
jgi:hypothetical protein